MIAGAPRSGYGKARKGYECVSEEHVGEMRLVSAERWMYGGLRTEEVMASTAFSRSMSALNRQQ